MHRAPPASMTTLPFEQMPMPPPQPPPTMSVLQRAILQSDQQLNMNPSFPSMMGNSNGITPFQPFDLISSPNQSGFPVGSNPNAVPFSMQSNVHSSPGRMNNPIRMESPQINSSPPISHPSPPSQHVTPQQVTSPRVSGGSTLQFVPSQVLRNMPKK